MHLDVNAPLHHVNIGSTLVKGTFGLFGVRLRATKIGHVLIVVNPMVFKYNDWIIFIANLVATKNSWSPFLWWSKFFGHQLCDDQKQSSCHAIKKFSYHRLSNWKFSTWMVTKSIPLPIVWRLIFLGSPSIFGF